MRWLVPAVPAAIETAFAVPGLGDLNDRDLDTEYAAPGAGDVDET